MNTAFTVQKVAEQIMVYKPTRTQSYVSFFRDCKINRENCYFCPFAGPNRVSDITIGDYWGIEKAHPELVRNPDYEEKKGISCLLLNSDKGQELFEEMAGRINYSPSEFEKVAVNNEQLNTSPVMSEERQQIMDIYKKKGYEEVDRYFHRKYLKQIIMHTTYNMIPRKLRLNLKKVLKG